MPGNGTSRLSSHRLRRLAIGAVLTAAAALLSGCGQQFVLLHPQGTVGQTELHMLLLASAVMGIVILFVFVLLAVTVLRFRERKQRKAPYLPEYADNRRLEILWFVIPAVILTIIAVPTVTRTFQLAHLPPKRDPLVVDVTSLSWKWLFEYPAQHLATVNYLVLPAGKPVLFRLTADSAMNTFWIPALGGMEYLMPGEVLPLWLQANKPGTYWGHSGNFSGVDFEKMFFTVRVVRPSGFAAWVAQSRRTAPPLTLKDYQALRAFGTTGTHTYASFPAGTFPAEASGFSLEGGHYVPVTGGGTAPMPMGLTADIAAARGTANG
jgi:heme/copper-type cytochrome/quinol oxidase subunit 2